MFPLRRNIARGEKTTPGWREGGRPTEADLHPLLFTEYREEFLWDSSIIQLVPSLVVCPKSDLGLIDVDSTPS